MELAVYDFDGTLFRSPTPPVGWDIKNDWWNNSESLGEPCVADNPGSSLWVAPIVARAKQSINDQDVWAVLCTGRSLRSFARWRVPELLRIAGLDFDEVLLNTGTNTPQFKAASVWEILNKYPDIQTVHLWDDDATNLKAMETAVKRAGRVCVPHQVKRAESPCKGNTGKVAGIIEAPPKLVKEITRWAFHVTAEGRIQNIEKTLASQFRNTPPEKLSEAHKDLIEKARQEQAFLRKYVSSKYTGWSRQFRISDYLAGWKYTNIIAKTESLYLHQLKSAERAYAGKLRQFRNLGKYTESLEIQMEVNILRNKLEYLRESGVSDSRKYTDQTEIRVILIVHGYDRFNSPTLGGSWDRDGKSIRVDLPASLIRQQDRDQLESVIEHECRHFAQSYLQDALGVAEAGLPPRQIRTPQYDQNAPLFGTGAQLSHHLDDTEFFTDLGNEIRVFKAFLVQNKTPKKLWDEALDVFTHVKDRTPGSDFRGSLFFYNLKYNDVARGKYLRAVKEIRKVFKYKGNAKVADQRSKMLSPEIRVATRWATRIARLPTPESKAWDKDIKAREKHVKGALAAFKGLLKALQPYADQAYAAHSGKAPEEVSRRGKTFVKMVKGIPEVLSYLDTWVGGDAHHLAAYSWRNQVIYQARDTILFKKPLRETLVEIGKQADKGFEALAMAESQSAIRKVLPAELRAFLPQRIVVDVDPDGTIKRVTDRFEAEYETLGIKVKTQHTLLNRYNAVAKQVKKDMRSGAEITRMAALITAILMETGIRPGKEGNKVVQMQDGKQVDIETFGAITLGPTHVNFIKDSFVKLEFVGKKGGTNIATLTDPEIIKLLRVYVEQARKGGSPYIFVTALGQTFTYTDLQRYFREHFSEFSPTDFRKLKATETVLSYLREEQKSLYTRIRDFVTGKKSDLKEQVVQEVVSSIQRAYEHAQTALSHEDVATTIRAYVNPEVLLRFLSRGGIEETLKDALMSGKTSLSFDPDVFIAQAMKTGSAGGTTLGDLLEMLEEDLELR